MVFLCIPPQDLHSLRVMRPPFPPCSSPKGTHTGFKEPYPVSKLADSVINASGSLPSPTPLPPEEHHLYPLRQDHTGAIHQLVLTYRPDHDYVTPPSPAHSSVSRVNF